ncbi:DUF2129 domain-containing protein [Candidatus Izemoplasma sp. B36]|uniref:DUF2129 domain-containing protein n=1 Tax=Candidatus Izemoplasma sp. B36 TaxID=3242468 RepID=UPI003557EC83
MIDRKGIVIYFQNPKVIKIVKKYNVNITYVNKIGKYLTGYCDAKDYPTIKKELKKNRLIKKVDESLVEMPSIDI